MKKCEELEELIYAYIDNELVSQEKMQLETHLATCRGCQNTVEILRALKTTLKEKVVTLSVPVTLRERIRNRHTKRYSSIFLFPRWAYALVSVVIILGGIIFYQQRKTSHFLVLHASDKIQRHIDKCPACQKNAVKSIEEHINIVLAKKFQLQKHLNNCHACQNKIVQIIEDCMESMAWSTNEKQIEILFAMNSVFKFDKGDKIHVS